MDQLRWRRHVAAAKTHFAIPWVLQSLMSAFVWGWIAFGGNCIAYTLRIKWKYVSMFLCCIVSNPSLLFLWNVCAGHHNGLTERVGDAELTLCCDLLPAWAVLSSVPAAALSFTGELSFAISSFSSCRHPSCQNESRKYILSWAAVWDQHLASEIWNNPFPWNSWKLERNMYPFKHFTVTNVLKAVSHFLV